MILVRQFIIHHQWRVTGFTRQTKYLENYHKYWFKNNMYIYDGYFTCYIPHHLHHCPRLHYWSQDSAVLCCLLELC